MGSRDELRWGREGAVMGLVQLVRSLSTADVAGLVRSGSYGLADATRLVQSNSGGCIGQHLPRQEKKRVIGGTRTRNPRDHNPVL
jgi:hypothetical protein